MTAFKKQILEILVHEDCRYSPEKIATLLGAEAADVRAAVSELEREGVVVKYTAVVNPEKREEDFVDALIEVKVTPQKALGFDAIAEESYQFPEVKSVYLMSGGYDLCVMIEGRTLREVANFVSEKLSVMDTVISTATHFILKTYKKDGIILEEGERAKRIAVQP